MRTTIAVLDNNHSQRTDTIRKIDEYSRRRHADIHSEGFRTGTELVSTIRSQGQFDIYILETNLNDLNGFYIARELRAGNKRCKIIYYTENRNAALRAFEVHADNYVIKPASIEKFDSILDAAIASLERDRRSTLVEIRTRNGFIRIPSDEIAYINIVNRSLCYHMVDGSSVRSLILRESFRSAVDELLGDPHFCIAGASLLVNLANVQVVNRNLLIFNHGESLMLPRNAFKSLYYAWDAVKKTGCEINANF